MHLSSLPMTLPWWVLGKSSTVLLWSDQSTVSLSQRNGLKFKSMFQRCCKVRKIGYFLCDQLRCFWICHRREFQCAKTSSQGTYIPGTVWTTEPTYWKWSLVSVCTMSKVRHACTPVIFWNVYMDLVTYSSKKNYYGMSLCIMEQCQQEQCVNIHGNNTAYNSFWQ